MTLNQQGEYQLLELAEGVWSIEMGMVRAFLVLGETSALLIDTGAGGVNLRQAVLSVTSLPVRIVNTHAHFDHISGNGAFPMRFAHPMEIAALAKAGYQAAPVNDGSGFDLGGRLLQVVSLPGHSPGSIGLWDTEAGLLFAGDVVARGRAVILTMDGASLEAYQRALDRILAMEHDENGGKLERVFCAHGEAECGLDTVRALKALAEKYAAGEIEKGPLPEKIAASFADHVGLVRDGEASLLVN